MYYFYMGSVLLPIAPEKFTLKIGNANKTMTLINEGEINFIREAKLTELEFDVLIPAVQYSFANHPNVGRPFRGLLIVRLQQAIPDGTTGTIPISFTSDGSNPVPLTGFNGEPVTAASIPGTGIYICWYERTTNTLQLLTGIV